MENEKNRNGRGDPLDDVDGFWELDALLPPRAAPPPRPADVSTVEVSLGDGGERGTENGYRTYRYSAVPAQQKFGDTSKTQPDAANGGGASSEARKEVSGRKYAPITSSYASRGAVKIDYKEYLQRRREGIADPSFVQDGDECFEYVPKNPLIFRVKIIRRSDFDGIEERSYSDMKRMVGKTAVFTENVEFTALFPQYSRMTEEQRRCYIGFRTEVLSGRYPEVSESYILFLLYELINLPEHFPPKRAVEIFCSLMRAYRNCSDSLFSYMCDWLADLCLINRMDAPLELLEPVRERVYKRAIWKEFYVPFNAESAEPDACVLITSASEYDYRRSKFYSAETADYFETHIPKAVGAAIRGLSLSDAAVTNVTNDVTTLSHEGYRWAFRNAKCRYTVTIECACFTRSPLLRSMVSGLVKYSENFVREMLGIRSRLTVQCVAGEKKELINGYFAPLVKRERDRPPLKRGRKKKIPDQPPRSEIPEYEKYYEPQNVGFSAELAAKIESDSWNTTDMLLNAFGGVEASAESDAAQASETVAENDASGAFAGGADEKPENALYTVNSREKANSDGLTIPDPPAEKAEVREKIPQGERTVEICGLRLLLRGKSREFTQLARENGMLPDTLAERINGIALDTYGDIALEGDGTIGGFAIIEDYREELEELAR